MASDQDTRSLREIAGEIQRTWVRKDGTSSIYFGAVPYVHAMRGLETVNDTYGCDRASDIVRYFLANANTYRGEAARRIKAELRAML